jgi:hypothetical protein
VTTRWIRCDSFKTKSKRDAGMKILVARIVALAAVSALLLVFAFAYYVPIQDPYHPLNTDWDGCSGIAESYKNATLLFSYDKPLPNGDRSLLTIIGPMIPFALNDVAEVHTFLAAGGTVILADNVGAGNLLLEALNVDARISREPLADLYFYARNPEFPVAITFPSNPLTANLTAVVFNRPSYIQMGNANVTVLASSSPFSFVDFGSGRPVANETVTSYPLIVSTKVGKGSLIIIADPNIFINEMLGLFDNLLLFRNLMNGNNHLVIDVAHLKNAPFTTSRIFLRDEIGSIGEFLFFGQSGALVRWGSLIGIILGFSVQIIRRIRREKSASIPTRNYA